MINIPTSLSFFNIEGVGYPTYPNWLFYKRKLINEFYESSKEIQQFVEYPEENDYFKENPYLIIKNKEGQTNGYILKAVVQSNSQTASGWDPQIQYSLSLYYCDNLEEINDNNLTYIFNTFFIGYLTVSYYGDRGISDQSGKNKQFNFNYTIIPINANCEALLFTHNETDLKPYFCFIRYKKNSDYIFVFLRLTPGYTNGTESYASISQTYNSPDTDFSSSHNRRLEFYSTKEGRIFSQQNDNVHYNLFYWDKINQAEMSKTYYPLKVGDDFIPDVWFFNGGNALPHEINEVSLDGVDYYSFYFNILIKNNRCDDVWKEKIKNVEKQIVSDDNVEIILNEYEITDIASQGAHFVLNNASSTEDYIVRFYVNNVLYKMGTLEHKGTILASDLKIDDVSSGNIYRSYGDKPFLIKANYGDKISIRYYGKLTNNVRILYANLAFQEKNFCTDENNTVLFKSKIYKTDGETLAKEVEVKKTNTNMTYYTLTNFLDTSFGDIGFLAMSENSSIGIQVNKTDSGEGTTDCYAEKYIIPQSSMSTYKVEFSLNNDKKTYYINSNILSFGWKNSYGNFSSGIDWNRIRLGWMNTWRHLGDNGEGTARGFENCVYNLDTSNLYYASTQFSSHGYYDNITANLNTQSIIDENSYLTQGDNVNKYKQLNTMICYSLTNHLGTDEIDNTKSPEANKCWMSPEAIYNLATLIESWEDQNAINEYVEGD